MERKPKITGRPGAYECRGARFVGYGETPDEAFGDLRGEEMREETLRWETEALREPKLAPWLQKFVDRLYGDNLTKGEGRG